MERGKKAEKKGKTPGVPPSLQPLGARNGRLISRHVMYFRPADGEHWLAGWRWGGW